MHTLLVIDDRITRRKMYNSKHDWVSLFLFAVGEDLKNFSDLSQFLTLFVFIALISKCSIVVSILGQIATYVLKIK